MNQQRPTENSFKIEPTHIDFIYSNAREDSLRCTIKTIEKTYETEISDVLIPLVLKASEKINDEKIYINMWAENPDNGERNITITSLGLTQL
ncbi:hypothetical protein [Pseudomonas putida]|uniref:Uncharacterized protein n=1 Tax=Pseudomonas putida TaxID=303 RepID=A0A6I6XLV1_PSEPU|nr:hypothetical protein [Pseudomonas putida]QHG66638.1 hypothetical protein C2H86_20475 [Pseudomonas putida]